MIELTVYLTIGEGCYLKLRGKKIYIHAVPEMPAGEEQWWIESERRGHTARVRVRDIEYLDVDRIEKDGKHWYLGRFAPGEAIGAEILDRLAVTGDKIYLP